METAPLHTEISPAPKDGAAYWVHADDGVRLRVAVWPAKKSSLGTIFFFPGRGDYIELYGHTISDLVAAGYTTIVIDWRGHGLSDRVSDNPKLGHVGNFLDYQKDVNAMTKAGDELSLPKPWYLVGHSMGACVGLRSLINGMPVSGSAFSAPMWDIHISPLERAAAWPVTWLLKTVGKGQIFAPGYNAESYVFRHDFESNNLTNSAEKYQYWIDQGTAVPELHTGGPSMGWLFEALKETRALSKLAAPDVPCISFCGDQEEVVGADTIKDRMAHWPEGRFEMVPGGKHELLLEVPEARDPVLDKMVAFFGSLSVDLP